MIASLKAEHGAAFDRDYVNGQVDHQRGNAALFQYEIQNGTDPDLKEFARRTLPKIEDYLQRALRLAKNSKLGTSVFKTRRLLSLLKVAHRECARACNWGPTPSRRRVRYQTQIVPVLSDN
jgi:hypothetical protein